MVAVTARLRFGRAPRDVPHRVWRNDEVIARCDFRDDVSGALMDVSGVAARVWKPGGEELSALLVTLVRESVGVWRATWLADLSGTWRVSIGCAEPSDAEDAADVVVVAAEPTDDAPIPPTWPEIVDLVDAATVQAESAAASADLAISALEPSLLLEDGGRLRQEDGSRVRQEVSPLPFDYPTYEAGLSPIGDLAGTERVVVRGGGMPGVTTVDDIADRVIASGEVAEARHFHTDDDVREHFARVSSWPILDVNGLPFWITLNNAQPRYALSGADMGRRGRVVNAGAFLDCAGLPVNQGFFLLDVEAGADCLLFSGSGSTWRNTGGTMLLAAGGSLVMILKGQSQCMAVPLLGSVSASAASPPAAEDTVALIGQSWPQRADAHGLYGMQWLREQHGLLRYVFSILDASKGASSMEIGGATILANHWHNRNTGLLGPNYVGSVPDGITGALSIVQAAIAANPQAPTLGAIFWWIGANDFPVFDSAGPVTIPILTAAYVAVASAWRADLGLPTLPFFILPMMSTDSTNVDPRKQYAQRFAQLDACAASPYNLRGPDSYDVPHPWADGVHHTMAGMAEIGARMMQFRLRQQGMNVYLGPKMTGFARIAPRQYRCTLDRFGGVSPTGLNVEPMQLPDRPLGFEVLPNGDRWADPIPTEDWDWDGDNLVVRTVADDAAAIPAYPWGHMPTASIEPTRIVRCRDRVSGLVLPLQTYHPNPAI
jgi:hypothetical protein